MNVEAAWLRTVEDGVTEVWAKCSSCHTDRVVMTNARDPLEGQPFCTCVRCGRFLYSPDTRNSLVDLVVAHGWNRAISWLMAQDIGDANGH